MADHAVDAEPCVGEGRGGRRQLADRFRGLARFTDRRVLVMLGTLAVVLLGLSLYVSPPGGKAGLAQWASGGLSDLGAGVVGSCVTFFLVDLRLNRQREEEARLEAARAQTAQQAREDEQRRLALIALVRSQNIHDARSAIEELRLRGWLSDGSLRGVDFSAANLRGINLSGASLAEAIFRGADLRDADFSGADLRRCNFEMADIRGWRVRQAILADADFTNANRS